MPAKGVIQPLSVMGLAVLRYHELIPEERDACRRRESADK
jgi:hypothetical protein